MLALGRRQGGGGGGASSYASTSTSWTNDPRGTLNSVRVSSSTLTRASCHQKSLRAEAMSSNLTLALEGTQRGGEAAPAANTARFTFDDDGESAGAEFTYQTSRAFATANPPMPTPMPIGGRSQSVAVALTVSFVFSSRSQTGPVGSRTLFGNAVYRVTGIEGSNPSRSGFRLQNKGFPALPGDRSRGGDAALYSIRLMPSAVAWMRGLRGHGWSICARARPGILTSITTTSGLAAAAAATASSAELASPITSMVRSDSSSPRSPRRTNSWSSQSSTRTRVVATMPV
jgi:hypothetical protein